MALQPESAFQRFTWRQIKSQSEVYTTIYSQIIRDLLPGFLSRVGLGEQAGRILLRRSIVPLVHFYLDRGLRAIDAGGCPVLEDRWLRLSQFGIQSLEHFEQKVTSDVELNGAFLGATFRRLTGLDMQSIPNKNFLKDSLFRRIKTRCQLDLAKRGGKIPVLGFSYCLRAFLDEGLVGWRGFVPLPKLPELQAPIQQVSHRSPWIKQIKQERLDELVRNLLATIGHNGGERALELQAGLQTFLIHNFPGEYLEGFDVNSRAYTPLFSKYASKILFHEGVGNMKQTFAVAIAKQSGFRLVGHQHGGHYGYVQDHTAFNQLEAYFCDEFLTWGWADYPESPRDHCIKYVSGTSPWLAHRSERLMNHKTEGCPVFDFVFMTNKIYRFPPAPSGAAVCRADFIEELTNQLVSVASYAERFKVKVLHKPYNYETVELLGGELRKLESPWFTTVKEIEKGMTPEFLSQARCVVWDQPGTGFLECIARGIPTKVLHTQIYFRHGEWASSLRCDESIVHDSVDSLYKSIVRGDFNLVDPRKYSELLDCSRFECWAGYFRGLLEAKV